MSYILSGLHDFREIDQATSVTRRSCPEVEMAKMVTARGSHLSFKISLQKQTGDMTEGLSI